jgi:hypothetical protein
VKFDGGTEVLVAYDGFRREGSPGGHEIGPVMPLAQFAVPVEAD